MLRTETHFQKSTQVVGKDFVVVFVVCFVLFAQRKNGLYSVHIKIYFHMHFSHL